MQLDTRKTGKNIQSPYFNNMKKDSLGYYLFGVEGNILEKVKYQFKTLFSVKDH